MRRVAGLSTVLGRILKVQELERRLSDPNRTERLASMEKGWGHSWDTCSTSSIFNVRLERDQ